MVRSTTIFRLNHHYVRLTGLEPARQKHQILSLARLPIPPQARENALSLGLYAQNVCKGTNKNSFRQKFSGKFYQRVPSKEKILVSLTDGIVGSDTEFHLLMVLVV